ncbi:MAG: hypothetical protein GF320_14320 [Armatimonadia bacterium]|nr:hypothetical protein [Armatimonadia bacterium]
MSGNMIVTRQAGAALPTPTLRDSVLLTRPRVLINPDDLPYLREHYNDAGVHAGFWSSVVSKCDLSGNWDQVWETDGIAPVRESGWSAAACCYRAMVLGSSDTAYDSLLSKVQSWIENVLTWHHTSHTADYTADWQSRAVITGLAAAFDVFHNDLSYSLLNGIADVLVTRTDTLYLVDEYFEAISKLRSHGEEKPSYRDYWYSRAYENVYSMVFAAGALWGYSDGYTDHCTRWIAWLIARLMSCMGAYPWAMFDEARKGGSGEGIGYQNYRDFHMGPAQGVRILKDMGIWDAFAKSGYWQNVHRHLMGTNNPFNLMDFGADESSVMGGWGDLSELQFNELWGWRVAAFTQDPAMVWWAKQRFRRNGWPPGDSGSYVSDKWPWWDHYMSVRWYADDLDTVSSAPTDAEMEYYNLSDTDVVSMTDQYTDPARSLVLSFKSARYPMCSTGHAHGDDNSFMLAYGPDWVFPSVGRYPELDSGRTALKNCMIFGDPSTWNWSNWGGAAEQKWGEFGFSSRYNKHAQILGASNPGDYSYAYGEAGTCYQSLDSCWWLRGITLVRRGSNALPYIVILDEADTGADALNYHWLLGALAELDPFTIDDVNHTVDWARSNGSGGYYSNSRCHLQLLFPSGGATPASMTATQWPEWTPGWTNLRCHRLDVAFSGLTSLVMAAVIVPYVSGDTPAPPSWTYGITGTGPYVVTVDDGSAGDDQITFDLSNYTVSVVSS